MSKPLFSIQVDDLIIQQIFQEYSKRISDQQEEIARLKADLESRPTREQFEAVSAALIDVQRQLACSSSGYKDSLEGMRRSLEEKTFDMESLLQKKCSEMIFSVNAAIRGEMDRIGLECEIPKYLTGTISSTDLKVQKLCAKVEELNNSVISGFEAVDETSRIKHGDIQSFMRSACVRARKRVADIEESVSRMNAAVSSCQVRFDLLVPIDGMLKEIPTTGVPSSLLFKGTKSMYDYLNYAACSIPVIGSSVKALEIDISNCRERINSKADSLTVDSELSEIKSMIKGLTEKIDDYWSRKDTVVTRNEFSELRKQLMEIANGTAKSSMRCMACGKALNK